MSQKIVDGSLNDSMTLEELIKKYEKESTEKRQIANYLKDLKRYQDGEYRRSCEFCKYEKKSVFEKPCSACRHSYLDLFKSKCGK